MADDADRAQDTIEGRDTAALEKVQRRLLKTPVGEPGECEWCGDYFARLVSGACGRCRDKFKLP